MTTYAADIPCLCMSSWRNFVKAPAV